MAMATAAPPARISAPLVGALEGCWAGIRRRQPEVPPAVIVVASGTDGRPSQARWGHFAALRWVAGTTELPEVLIAGEGLGRPPAAVLATLLHEAAHGLAHTRDIQDVSRQGRYHNKRFARLAEELGLDVAEVGTLGWSQTTLRPATEADYRRELATLTAALTLFRRGEGTGGRKERKSTNLLAATCACGRRIRVARATLTAGPITCGICDGEFTADEEETR